MKKNKMMRLASILLVVTLLSTSIISGTFAKYTTQDSASDSARVAKWGVSLQVIGNLYGEAYKDAIVANGDTSLTVLANDHASADDDVVAPGTKNGEGFKFSLTGTPEVSSQAVVTIKAQNVFLNAGKYGLMVEVSTGTVTAENFAVLGDLYTQTSGTYTKAASYTASTTYYTLEDYVEVSDNYYPVVYKLTGDTSYTGADNEDTIKEIAALIAGKFGTVSPAPSTDSNNVTTYTVTSAVIAPNTDLDDHFMVDDEVITWEWAFGGAETGDNATENDKADTILGLLMARAAAGADRLDGTVVKLDGTDYKAPTEHTDFCLDTSFELNITVNQVD